MKLKWANEVENGPKKQKMTNQVKNYSIKFINIDTG